MVAVHRGLRSDKIKTGNFLGTDSRITLIVLASSIAIWWFCEFHAAALPFLAPWDFSFSWFYAAIFPTVWYFRGLARTTAASRPAHWRSVVFILGMLAIYFVLQTHFDYLAQHMFFLNRLQHVVMHHLGPFLIALAWPWQTLMLGMPEIVQRLSTSKGVSRFLLLMRRPLLAALVFVGLIALWLIPTVHFRAMIDPKLYLLMNWSMVGDGLLFWSLVLDPRSAAQAGISFGWRAALAVGVMFPQILIGAIIALSNHDIYNFYAWCGRIYPTIGALDDQNYGGGIVWIPPAMMSVAALLLVLNALRLNDEAEEASAPGHSGIAEER